MKRDIRRGIDRSVSRSASGDAEEKKTMADDALHATLLKTGILSSIA
jgi:hypothetical protein